LGTIFQANHFLVQKPGLTSSPPIWLRLYTLPYCSNPPLLIFDIWALQRSRLSAGEPICQKLKVVGYSSMALDHLNGNMEQLALKGLHQIKLQQNYNIKT